MRTVIFLFILLLCANGFPITSNRVKRNEEDECDEVKKDEDKKDETPKNEGKEDLDINEISRRSCEHGKHFVGSNLFDGARKICFTLDEVNLLIARKDFEMMLPRDLPQDLLDDKSAADVLRYFYYGLYLLDSIEDCEIRHKIEKAYYDTMGGFLFYYLLPVVKYSYYAGKLDLKTVRGVAVLYHRSRIYLNTNGNGWRPPIRDPTVEFANIRIEPLKIPQIEACLRDKIACGDLDLSTANDEDIVDDNMIVALPKLMLEDPEGFLNNIWLPFSRKRTFNLRSCKSAFIFVKFYRSVSLCYEQKGMDRKIFDHKFRQWVVENVKVHLGDEVFYPGLGGILNVYETLRGFCNNKSVAKRNSLKRAEDNDVALIEQRSCSYANVVEGSNLRLRKRAINNEELEYVNFIARNMPIDAEDKKADEWIKKFDESTLNECCGEKVTIIKCKPKDACCPKPKCKPTCSIPCKDPCARGTKKYWFLAFLGHILMLLGACWFGMKYGDGYWEELKDFFKELLDEFICSKLSKKKGGKKGKSPKKSGKSPKKKKSPKKGKKKK